MGGFHKGCHVMPPLTSLLPPHRGLALPHSPTVTVQIGIGHRITGSPCGVRRTWSLMTSGDFRINITSLCTQRPSLNRLPYHLTDVVTRNMPDLSNPAAYIRTILNNSDSFSLTSLTSPVTWPVPRRYSHVLLTAWRVRSIGEWDIVDLFYPRALSHLIQH